jgi:energy-coupling factor transporter ATP-binding protein EcfA2
MSLTFNNVGKPVAKIKGGKYNNKIISINPDINDNDATDFKHLKIANDSKLQHVPDTTKEREIIYITGPSGSGKSTYTRMFLEEYKKKYKDREIYMFSSLKEDPSLDKIKPKRFKIDDSLWKDPIEAEELKDSVCIFDDIDVILRAKDKGGGVQHPQQGTGNRQALQYHVYHHQSLTYQRKRYTAYPQRGPRLRVFPSQRGR